MRVKEGGFLISEKAPQDDPGKTESPDDFGNPHLFPD